LYAVLDLGAADDPPPTAVGGNYSRVID